MRKLETNDWWAELIQLKDQMSLRELAEKFNVTPGAISAALKREGMSRDPAPPGPRLHRRGRAGEDDLPPEAGEGRRRLVRPDRARRDAVADDERPGSKDAQIAAVTDLLGKVPDAEAATKAGVSPRTIANYRARHEIPGYRGPRRPPTSRKRSSKVDDYVDLLGTMPDREVAERAGVTVNAVRNYRVKLGIAASGRAVTGAAPGAGAWQVTVDVDGQRQEWVVIASDLVDAATQAAAAASSHLGGDVVSIAWVGAVL